MSTVLFTLSPITGHVRPALPIVRALADAGHDVVVYTGSKFADAIRAAGGQPVAPVRGRDLDDALIDEWSIAHGAPAPGVRRLQWDVVHHFIEPVDGFLADLEDVVAERRPDVLVADNAFVAGALLALRHDLPSVALTVSPLAVTSRDLAPYGLGLQPPTTAAGRVRARALAVLVEKVVFRDAQRQALAAVERAGLPRPGGFFFDWVHTLTTRVLHLSVPGLEYPRSDLPAHVEIVGACLPRGVDRFEEPAWWQDVLDARAAGRPVVLVTQGTIATDPSRLLVPALRALAGQDVLVVATTGTAQAEEALGGEPVPANVRLTRFVPFDRLLPLVDVVVTNGGFGGVQLALAHGVPLVVAGRSEDKAEVGARVAWSGAGVALRTDRTTDATTPEEVARGVRTVLDDATFRTAAQRLAAEYAERDGLARTVEVVEELAAAHRPALVR